MNTHAKPMTPAQLTDKLDALASEFMTGAAACGADRRAALRSARATWCAVMSHAEHRVQQINRAAQPAEGRA